MTPPWHIVAMGSAPGEAAHLSALCVAARKRGQSLVAWAQNENAARQLGATGAAVRRFRAGPEIASTLRQEGFSALVACSSYTAHAFFRDARGLEGPVVCIDSSCMPWSRSREHDLTRVDRFLVAMPDEVFLRGLERNVGAYSIPPSVLERIRPVGWFAEPSDEPPEDLVLCYFSRGAVPWGFWWGQTIGAAIELAAARCPGRRWVWVGNPGIPLPALVELRRGWVEEPEMEALHRRAALLLCHEGQVTIGRAAVAGARVLCVSSGFVFRHDVGLVYAGREAQGFSRAGVVETIHGPAPAAAIARRIVGLLEAGRATPHPGGGALRAVLEVEALIGGR